MFAGLAEETKSVEVATPVQEERNVLGFLLTGWGIALTAGVLYYLYFMDDK